MTNRERFQAILDSESPDRIPWIPRLQIWHTAHSKNHTLPARFRDLSLRQIERELGMGTPARDGHVFTKVQQGDVETTVEEEGHTRITTYRTPAGTVSTRHRSSEELDQLGIGSLEVEHMIKGPDDFAPVTYMVENTHYDPDYQAYRDYEAEIGDDGFPLVDIGDCPIHHFLQKFCGYQEGFYHMADHPDKVERLVRTMEEVERERMWPLVAASPARLFLHGVHFDSMLTPPPLFRQWITPYYQDFSELLDHSEKMLCMHADNDSRLILDDIKQAGYGMVETFTTAPQVSCTLEEARAAWGNDLIIWGGVPSVILEETFSDDEFATFMYGIFDTVAPGDAFILGVADNIMPGALLHRLEQIAEMVEVWGKYPIEPSQIEPVVS